jgi:hypothetical protein
MHELTTMPTENIASHLRALALAISNNAAEIMKSRTVYEGDIDQIREHLDAIKPYLKRLASIAGD